MRRAIVAGACCLAALLVFLPGCRREGEARPVERARVDRVGDRELTDAEFRRFVMMRGLDPAKVDPAALDRLWEEFLAEILLARAAEREGLAPSAEELDRVMEFMADVAPGADGSDLAREARRRALARLYVQRVLLPRVKVSPEEVESALPARKGTRGRHYVVFRQIRVEDEKAAREAWRRVVRKKEPFDEVAREVSTAPDRGRLQQRDVDLLPPRVADVLARLPVGSISRPVAFDGAYYLFELEARNRDPDPGRARERREVEDRLFREKLDRLVQETVRRLAREEGIRPPRLADGDEEER